MRTYFIHGKMTLRGFHIKATQLRKSPSGYYFICEQISESQHEALNLLIAVRQMENKHIKEAELSLDPHIQSTFIKT